MQQYLFPHLPCRGVDVVTAAVVVVAAVVLSGTVFCIHFAWAMNKRADDLKHVNSNFSRAFNSKHPKNLYKSSPNLLYSTLNIEPTPDKQSTLSLIHI